MFGYAGVPRESRVETWGRGGGGEKNARRVAPVARGRRGLGTTRRVVLLLYAVVLLPSSSVEVGAERNEGQRYEGHARETWKLVDLGF
jgi:hypothetical protein